MSNIKINKQEWNALSQEMQNTITDTLRSAGSLKDGGEIIGDENTPATNGTISNEVIKSASEGVCEIACYAARDVAYEACNKLLWPASVVCKTLADSACETCIDYCKL